MKEVHQLTFRKLILLLFTHRRWKCLKTGGAEMGGTWGGVPLPEWGVCGALSR